MRLRLLAAWVVLGLGMSSLTSCGLKIGKVPDEAKRADREPESLKAADEDYFQDMDYGLTKNPVTVADALSPYASPASRLRPRSRPPWRAATRG